MRSAYHLTSRAEAVIFFFFHSLEHSQCSSLVICAKQKWKFKGQCHAQRCIRCSGIKAHCVSLCLFNWVFSDQVQPFVGAARGWQHCAGLHAFQYHRQHLLLSAGIP